MPSRKPLLHALNLINSELSIVQMDLAHPDRFLEFPSENSPLAHWNGPIAEIIELSIGPQASGRLQHPSGRPMNYEESIKLLEKIFGITIADPYDRRGKILDRQKNTRFQDEMRLVFLQEAKKRSK